MEKRQLKSDDEDDDDYGPQQEGDQGQGSGGEDENILLSETIAASEGKRGSNVEDDDDEEEDDEEEDDDDDDEEEEEEANEGGGERSRGKRKASSSCSDRGGSNSDLLHGVHEAQDLEASVARATRAHFVPWGNRGRPNTVRLLEARALGFRKGVADDMAFSSQLFNLPGAGCPPLRSYRRLRHSFQHRVFCTQFSKGGDMLMVGSQDDTIRLFDTKRLYQWMSEDRKRKKKARDIPEARAEVPENVSQQQAGGLHRFARAVLGRAMGRDRRVMGGRQHDRDESQEEEEEEDQEEDHMTAEPAPLKTIACRDIGWSVLSTAFSADDKWLAYSSWSRYVHLCNTSGEHEMHEAHKFSDSTGHFSLFCIDFSPNSTHIAGSGSEGNVYVYNLERKTVVAVGKGHLDDVNTVCYVDDSPHLLLSGSDDATVLLWDLRDPQAAVGGFLGHSVGITCLDSKKDGRYFISNGKDQVMRLWDLRTVRPGAENVVKQAPRSNFDYRQSSYSLRRVRRANTSEVDMSVRRFEGHSVLHTLIRCYFSPLHTTGQKYVMSGGKDGRICTWDVTTGRMVHKLEAHANVVRDFAPHPYIPSFMASGSWDGSLALWS